MRRSSRILILGLVSWASICANGTILAQLSRLSRDTSGHVGGGLADYSRIRVRVEARSPQEKTESAEQDFAASPRLSPQSPLLDANRPILYFDTIKSLLSPTAP